MGFCFVFLFKLYEKYFPKDLFFFYYYSFQCYHPQLPETIFFFFSVFNFHIFFAAPGTFIEKISIYLLISICLIPQIMLFFLISLATLDRIFSYFYICYHLRRNHSPSLYQLCRERTFTRKQFCGVDLRPSLPTINYRY